MQLRAGPIILDPEDDETAEMNGESTISASDLENGIVIESVGNFSIRDLHSDARLECFLHEDDLVISSSTGMIMDWSRKAESGGDACWSDFWLSSEESIPSDLFPGEGILSAGDFFEETVDGDVREGGGNRNVVLKRLVGMVYSVTIR